MKICDTKLKGLQNENIEMCFNRKNKEFDVCKKRNVIWPHWCLVYF